MNNFVRAINSAIERHGIISTYKTVADPAYNITTGIVTAAETSYSFKIYMKQLIANQFNYPNLIGKEAGVFYIDASRITFIPKVQDLIIYNSKTYKIQSLQSFAANGQIVLYKLVGAA